MSLSRATLTIALGTSRKFHGGRLPELLTVEEAARLIRVGRTKAYAMANEWRATDGRSGLPVVDLGNALRVPLHELEAVLHTTFDATALADISARPFDDEAPGPKSSNGNGSEPSTDRGRSGVSRSEPKEASSVQSARGDAATPTPTPAPSRRRRSAPKSSPSQLALFGSSSLPEEVDADARLALRPTSRPTDTCHPCGGARAGRCGNAGGNPGSSSC